MNTGQLERLLVEARSFLNDAVPALRAGRTTQALVDADAALNRLRSVMDLYKHYIPELVETPVFDESQN